jgi:NodT family efflux transporter outer membrane factor (OMF) lipoprotein
MENLAGRIGALPRILTGAAGIAMLLLGQGCTVGPAYVRPSVSTPAAFKEAAATVAPDGTSWAPANPQDAAARGAWWKIYQEPELDELEDKLNSSNQNIAQAYQNFMAARAQVNQARASYAPTATLQPAYTRSGSSASTTAGGGLLGSSFANQRFTSNDFNFPLDVSWEPDLWGRIRNTVREYANAAQVSAADLANEKLSEQANLAEDYFELRGQDQLIALNEQTIQAYRTSLELTQVLGDTGIDDEQSVAQARLNLKTAEAAATNLGIARAQYEHAIALLIGQPASSFSIPARPLTTALPAIPVGVPSELLQRRPDIAAAERTMSQANALIGVETAGFSRSGRPLPRPFSMADCARRRSHNIRPNMRATWPHTVRPCWPPSSRRKTTWPPNASWANNSNNNGRWSPRRNAITILRRFAIGPAWTPTSTSSWRKPPCSPTSRQ